MKVLLLNGSPRKDGNTESLVKAFEQGAKKHGEVEIINVCDININPCKGCDYCLNSEGHACVQKDGMSEIYKKLQTADVLVVASPVYFYSLSAQLKALIDRCHTPLRKEFGIKKIALMLVGAAELPELFDSILVQYNLIKNYFNLEDLGKVLVRGAREKGEVSEEDLNKAFKLGESIK